MLAVQVSFNDLQEKIRHNKVTEELTAQELQIKRDQLNEAIRSNMVNEDQGWSKIYLAQDELNEKIRSNQVNEGIRGYEAETGRLNAYANQLGASASWENSITRANELTWDKYKYYDTGKTYTEAQTRLTNMNRVAAASNALAQAANALSSNSSLSSNLFSGIFSTASKMLK